MHRGVFGLNQGIPAHLFPAPPVAVQQQRVQAHAEAPGQARQLLYFWRCRAALPFLHRLARYFHFRRQLVLGKARLRPQAD